MEWGIQFIVWIICGCICAAIAHGKGRTPVGWFFMGLLGIIGIIITAVMPNERERERVQTHARADRRRLREQLRQERMKSEAYRRHAAARLDAHDEHLGIDTRQISSLPPGHGAQGMPQQLAAGGPDPLGQTAPMAPGAVSNPGGFKAPEGGLSGAISEAAASAPRVKEWFYELNGESRGPVSEAAIRNGLAQGKIEATTLVWREGMPNWQAVSEVTLFRSNFQG